MIRFVLRMGLVIGMMVCGMALMTENISAQSSANDLNIKKRLVDDIWVYDNAGLLSGESETRISESLKLFFEDNDIEFVSVTVNDLEGVDISQWTDRLFQNWDIGRKTRGHKGLLLVVAPKEQQVRLEVGSDLEGIYTDAFVGYIEHEQMMPFFEQGRVGAGLEATIEMIVGRTLERIKGGDYVPEQTAGLGGTAYRSAGGGAQKNMDFNSRSGPVKDTVDAGGKDFFAAQNSPMATVEKYTEVLRRHVKDPDLGIYTEATRNFFRQWTVTNAQQDNELRDIDLGAAVEKIKGDYAVIQFSSKGKEANPFFLKKGAEGWQLDFATMTKVIRFDQRNQWHFVSRDHPYMFAF